MWAERPDPPVPVPLGAIVFTVRLRIAAVDRCGAVGFHRDPPLGARLHVGLPVPVVEPADVSEVRDGEQVLGEPRQLVVGAPVQVGLPERPDREPIPRVHHEVPPQIIKHDGIRRIIELPEEEKKQIK